MRKTISLILSVLMILSSFSIITTISAKETNVVPTGATYSGTTGDCKWSFDEDTGTLTISGNGEMGDYYGDSSPWYDYLSAIKTIVIEDGVTSIGDYAFYDCSSLTSITIPDSVTSIGEFVFYNTAYYNDENNWDNGVLYLNNYLVKAKTDLEKCVVKDGTKVIAGGAFYYCSSLTSITIPDSVTSIGDDAFYNCSSLTSITIPDSVTSIGFFAFNGCSSLTSITIPDSVTSIGGEAFNGCSSLTSIDVDVENKYFSSVDGNLYNKDKTKIIQYAVGKKQNSFAILDSVTYIGFRAFYGCSSLTSITIPDSVTSISDGAFYGCSSLTSITIPDSVTSIGEYVFEGCSSLTSIDVDVENKYFSSVDGNLYNKDKTKIIQYAVGKKQNSFAIPDSVTSINGYAFCDCSSLTSITIPNSVTTIENGAFYDCSSLTSIDVDVENKYFSSVDGNLYNKDKTKIIQYAVGKKQNSFAIPDSVTSIGYDAFYGCSSLTSITIPNSVTYIGFCAFYGCSSLTSITIPNSVTSIGEYAFNGCSSLTSITIPDSVTSIGDDAFENCLSLTNITIPGSVTSIGKYAFNGCSSLTSITIPNRVTSIGDETFYNCTSLTSITIPDSVTSIGNSAFYGCSGLTSITIPDGITSIGKFAFWACSSLKNVYYIGTEEQWKSIEIGNNNDELLNANIAYNYSPTEPTTTTQPTTTKPTVKKVVKVSLRKKSVVLVKGRSTTVKATVTPTNATNKKLKWTTSNAKVATVNQSGKITAKGRGNATIKVMALDGSNKYATVKVTVKQPVTSVKLNRKSANLKVKGKAKQKTVTLKATVYPKNANNKSVSWKSSKSKIATVNSRGKVTAKKKGTCYITATAKDGSKKSAKCKIVVK